MRLDQFLQKTLGVSRQEARSILKSKKVVVNEEVIKQAKYQLDLSEDRVFYCDDELVYQEFFYLMLNKPKGFVSSHTHDGGTPIYSLLETYAFVDLHCAGRLDVDTTGLVLVTNDGQWSHRVTHPNQYCFKRYLVTLAKDITPLSIQQLEVGVQLHEGKALPAKVEILSPRQIYLEISEGKFHQVKRMLKAVGNEVVALHRDRIGHISLGELAEGDYRELTEAEIGEFLS